MDENPTHGFRAQPLWFLALFAIVAGQAGLTLLAFGGWHGLRDSKAIVSGRHPLHFYHGSLGAAMFNHRLSTACFDTSFQAGYPKTPVFDGGCRPAEFFLLLGGRGADAAVYKLGIFAVCLAVPVMLALAARGVGLSPSASCVAATLGIGVWWTTIVRSMLDAGDLDALIAGLTAIVFVCWLSRYHWEPSLFSCLILTSMCFIGWYAHPVLMLALAPLVALYYLAVAPQHELAWHLGLFTSFLSAITLNFWWLWDWGRFWWLRQPSVDDVAPLPTWGIVLDSWLSHAKLFGPAPFGWPMIVLALIGCLNLLIERRRSCVALIFMMMIQCVIVARLGQSWPPFMSVTTDRVAALVLALAVIPTAGWLTLWAKRSHLLTLWMCGAIGMPMVLGWWPSLGQRVYPQLAWRTEPFARGLTDHQEDLVRGILEHTTPTARILLEEVASESVGWNWTAMLPLLTERTYLGGLDPDARFEHGYTQLRGDRLNGRRLEEWTHGELLEFVRRYNIGWILTRTPHATEYWLRLPIAKRVARYNDGGELHLIRLDRTHSFVLQGQATVTHASRKHVILSDIVPADSPHPNGGPVSAKVVVLSLHYQAGLRVRPNIAVVERDPDPHDPIPMIRLRISGPMSRLVLSWENP
jgi:hypothetical protein